MVPKGQSKKFTEEMKNDDLLQALIVLNDLNHVFSALMEDSQQVQIPLVNHPLLDYTLEHLSLSGVQDIIIYCFTSTQQIRTFIKGSRWWNKSCFKISVVGSEDASSLGDAMRDIDAKGLLKSDFILISGLVVSNVNLKSLLDQHKKQQQMDKASVLSLVWKKSIPTHSMRRIASDFVAVLEPETQRVLDFQRIGHNSRLKIPLEVLTRKNGCQLHYDLMDTGIFICSPAVPPLFAENFDYETMDDFVRGILMNEEILGSTIYCLQVADQYAVCVDNLEKYASVSLDLVRRMAYPITHSGMACNNGTVSSYVQSHHNVYKHKSVQCARLTKLEQDVVIGSNTTIDTDCTISSCVIGNNCTIGTGNKLNYCFLWDNVNIGNDCSVDRSLVTNGCILGNGVTLKGCILGQNVHLPSGYKDHNLKIVSRIPEDQEDHLFEKVAEKAFILKDGMTSQDGDSDDEAQGGGSNSDGRFATKWHDFGRRADLLEMQPLDGRGSCSSSGSSSGSEDEDEGGAEEDMDGDAAYQTNDTKLFYSEVLDSLVRGLEEGVSTDNLILEINSSKYAYNIAAHDLGCQLFSALMSVPETRLKRKLNNDEALSQFQSTLKFGLPLLRNYIRKQDVEVECLEIMEDVLVKKNDFGKSLSKLIYFLYQSNIFTEDAVLGWYQSVLCSDDKEKTSCTAELVKPFIDWLNEAEESDEEDGDSDDTKD